MAAPPSFSTTPTPATFPASRCRGVPKRRLRRSRCSSTRRSPANSASTQRPCPAPAGAALFAGNALPEGVEPVAQAYAGHQFGGFSPQLGDGRALLLGEVVDPSGRRRDIAFKGSGRTPFSRGGDGKAAVGPMLREVLIGEAMHALGIPTTRALAVVATGGVVLREAGKLPGAVLTRVAASHIRVGTFQFFAARGDVERVRQLADYTIARHDPELADAPERYLRLLERACARQAALIAQWMNVGFIHGVMNTDNMTLSGETIDYGPCAFVEAYDPAAVFSSIDHGGRYAFGNQPGIAQWNLARLAETLLPLIADDAEVATARAVQRHRGLSGRVSERPAGRSARQARAVEIRAHRRRGRCGARPTTGSRCCMPARSTSRSPGVAWPTPLRATKRRCARSSPTRTRPTPGSNAGASVAPETTRTNSHGRPRGAGRRGARRPDARRQSLGDSAQPSRRGGPRGGIRRFRPGALRAPARRAAQPVRRVPGNARYAEPAPVDVTARYQTFCGT